MPEEIVPQKIVPEEMVHVTEDAFHRLQTPQPDEPATDENLVNAARVAIWNCEPGLSQCVHVAASKGHLTLTGVVEDDRQRSAIEAAVSALAGAEGLTNAIEVGGAPDSGGAAPAPPPARHQVTAEPMLYVTRYCGIEPYSLTAALHEAVDVLDRRFAEFGLPTPDEVVVIYRNRLPESVVLDIGYVVPESTAVETREDLKLGRTPEGAMLAAPAPFGSRRLFEAHDQLVQQAHLADLLPANYAWQRFPRAAARLRPDHPAAPLYLPLDPRRDTASAV